MLPQLQTNNSTFAGRYWNEYNVLRRYFPSDRDVSILSFGCSTGEEIYTIKSLFPQAQLFGCDHDWYNLRLARGLVGDAANIFHSTEAEVIGHGPYDIILCNSVLLRPTSIVNGRKSGIDPQMWSDIVNLMHACLKPGGILQIVNSNIPFRMHDVAETYEPLRSPLLLGPNFVDMFDTQGRLLCSGVNGAGVSAHCFRHLGEEGWRDLRPTDLDDVHFRKSGSPAIVHPVLDEKIPNVAERPRYASGSATYRPILTKDNRPSTHQEIDVGWTASVSDIYITRSTRRVWFDGTTANTGETSICLTGSAAGAYLEALTGREGSRMALGALHGAVPRQSPNI
ncbi:MAG: hypothetical protein K0M49_14740 [Arenimonas sp.]|nr:hypothetical protein [Rhizobium sp.]MBW8446875.1 hypothetical protein [Arenimonas sp.]